MLTPNDTSIDEIVHQALVAPRLVFVAPPGTRVVAREGFWQVITPTLRQGGMNEVAWSRLGDHEADEVIARTIAEYRALGIRFRWTVGPGSTPHDLAARLQRAGLEEVWSRVMYRSTAMPLAERAAELVDANSVADFTRAAAAGFDMDPGPLALMHRAMLAEPGGRQRLFVTRANGEAVGAASYLALEHSAFLNGASVNAKARGQGHYRALVAARLFDAQARGLQLVTTNARESTSAPRLERLGFATACRLQIFVG